MRCHQCKSYIRFTKDEDETFRITSFNTTHIHYPTLAKNQFLQQFIMDLPMDINLSTACKIAVNQLQETSSRFYYYYKKINFHQVKFRDFINSLDRQGY